MAIVPIIMNLSHVQTQLPKCINCSGEHYAFSKDCSHFKREILITQIKVDNKISYSHARDLYIQGNGDSNMLTYKTILASKTKIASKNKNNFPQLSSKGVELNGNNSNYKSSVPNIISMDKKVISGVNKNVKLSSNTYVPSWLTVNVPPS